MDNDPAGVKAYSVVDGIDTAQNDKEISAVIQHVGPRLGPVMRFMEVGVLHGGSALRYVRALCSPGATVILCDVDLPRFHKAASALAHDFAVWQTLPAEALEIEHRANKGLLLDLLHIDADHAYESVSRDWATYSPLVRPGGIVLLHDVCGKGGVIRFWSELRQTQRTLTIQCDNGPGIGVVYL